jgi:hypothetical protein
MLNRIDATPKYSAFIETIQVTFAECGILQKKRGVKHDEYSLTFLFWSDVFWISFILNVSRRVAIQRNVISNDLFDEELILNIANLNIWLNKIYFVCLKNTYRHHTLTLIIKYIKNIQYNNMEIMHLLTVLLRKQKLHLQYY